MFDLFSQFLLFIPVSPPSIIRTNKERSPALPPLPSIHHIAARVIFIKFNQITSEPSLKLPKDFLLNLKVQTLYKICKNLHHLALPTFLTPSHVIPLSPLLSMTWIPQSWTCWVYFYCLVFALAAHFVSIALIPDLSKVGLSLMKP